MKSSYIKNILLSATIIGSISFSSTSALAQPEIGTSYSELTNTIIQKTSSETNFGTRIARRRARSISVTDGLPVAVSHTENNDKTYNMTGTETITGYNDGSSNAWCKEYTITDSSGATTTATASNILKGNSLVIEGNNNIITSSATNVIGIEVGTNQELTVNKIKSWNTFNSAISNNGGQININNSTFENNLAKKITYNKIDGTSVTKDENGGAIANTAGVLNVNNSTFKNNAIGTSNSGFGGGAIYSNSLNTSNPVELVINNSSFSENSAITASKWQYGGGAIYHTNGNLTINDSIFTKNKTNARGGAIYLFGKNIKITNCEFNENSAGEIGVGGAIALTESRGTATITNSTITGNTAYAGGGIFTEGTVTIIADSTDSLIANNKSKNAGGAIQNYFGTVNLQTKNGGSITFINNTSGVGGSDINMHTSGGQYSKLNISGDGVVTFNGTIAGGNGIINKLDSGTLILNGDNSKYAGKYNQTGGSTIVNETGKLFAGIKNVNGGSLSVTSNLIDYTNVNLGNGATFNHLANDYSVTNIIDSSIIKFTGSGATAKFTTTPDISDKANYLLNENIQSTSGSNTLTFENSSIKLGQQSFSGDTIYNIKNSSILDLGENDGTIGNYVFDNLNTDGTTTLNFNINLNNGNMTTDTVTNNNGTSSFNIGKVFIGGSENGQKEYFSQVLYGTNNTFASASSSVLERIISATTIYEYNIELFGNQSIKLSALKATNNNSLYNINEASGNRFFQFSQGDAREYHIGQSLSETKSGNFSITGRSETASDSILSGLIADTTAGEKGSFFNITNGNNTNLNISNLTIQDADKNGNGSVIFNDSVNSVSTIINTNIKNNHATGNGGAIYNGVLKADNNSNLIISDTIFDGNTADGNGGAIYNAGNMSLTNTTFKQASDTVYMANNSVANLNGTNTFNSSISSENTNSTIINNGILNLNSDNSGYSGEYTQNSGITNVTGTFFNGNSEIHAGTLNWLTQNTTSGKLNVLGNSNLNIGNSTIKGELDLGTGSSIAESAKVFINTNSILNLKNNSTVTLDSTDTWGGKINLQDSANLTLNNVTNYSGAILNATGGTLNINNMNLNIGTNSFIDKNVSTNINSDATLSVNTGGNVTLGSTSNWIGKVVVNGGDFTTDGITSNGIIQAGSGNITIQNGNLNIKENSIINNAVKLSIKSTGILDIQGGTITIGNDDNWAGTINLGSSNQGGTLNYGTTNSGTLKAESGNLNLLSNSVLNIQSPSQVDKKVVVNIQNGATVNIKTGAIFNLDSLDKWNGLVSVSNGILKTDGIDNTKIGGKLQQTTGSSIFDNKSNILLDGQENYINGGNVSILNGSSLHLGNKVTTFVLDNLNMDGKSLFNTINNTVNKYGTIDNINIDGTNNISIDVSGRNWKSDTFVINNLNGTNGGTLNISNFNFVGLAPIDRHIKIQVFDAQNINNVNFTASDKKIFTPIGNYQMFSQGGGAYNASLVDYNPQVYRGQVATLAAYNHQLLINDMLTNHFILPNERLIDKAVQANKTSSISPLFTPYQSTIDNGGIWTKNYVSFETLSMTNNLKVGNNVYGTLIGADFPSIKLKKGWKYIPTAYIGYNGGMQGFNNVDMYQNGGQGGFMGTFIKNNFIGSITAYGGGYFNEMSVAGNTDRTGNWFAGTAAKVAYNIRATKHFIVQPTAFISYNIFGKQNWGTNFGSMSMNSGTLNGINVAPGMNLIYSRDTWSVYGTIQYMFNINDQVGGKAGNVNLPKTEMRHGYVNYGIGATKTWKDKLTSYFQINFRNGGRTGVGFQLGLNYLFDLGKPKNKTISQTTQIKPEKRVLKAGK